MDNLITVFMNHKINSLIKYGKLIYNRDDKFTNECLKAYFSTYIDNYYYNIFHTLNFDYYDDNNLELEFQGLMEEMLDEYLVYELQVSNSVYSKNVNCIKELKNICLEVVKLDKMNSNQLDDLVEETKKIINSSSLLKKLLVNKEKELLKLIKDNFQKQRKLLELKDNYFYLDYHKLKPTDEIHFVTLEKNIKVLDNYKKSITSKVFKDERLSLKKLECLINKLSLDILKKYLNNKPIQKTFLPITINHGKIPTSIIKLLDNPLFRKYVILGINYSNFLSQKDAFNLDYELGCIQDFSHINDVFSKTDSIYKEGIFNYLLVDGYKEQDKDFFINYENESLKILLFEEE